MLNDIAMSGGVDKAGPAAAPTDTVPLSDEEHGEEGRQESTADRGETAAEGTNGGLQAVVEQVLPAVNVEVTLEAQQRAMESRGAEASWAAILAESMQPTLAARQQAEVASAAENAGGAFGLNTTGAAGRGLGLAPEDVRTRVAAAGAGGAFGFGSGASGFAVGRASFGSLTDSDQRPGLLRREQDRQQDRLLQQREQGQRLIQQQVGSSPWFQLWWHSVSSSGVVCRQAQRLQGSDRISVR